jgi:choline kinase
MVTQTVILAAGLGRRLSAAEPGVPKPLLQIGGISLIEHTIAHAELSGCRDAVIVTGHEGERVREAVRRIRTGMKVHFVENADPTSPNGDSLSAAEPLAEPQFFLQMVDHLFGAPVLPALAAGLEDGDAGRLLIDSAPVGLDLSDATKVRVADGRISAIGKSVDPWDAIDTGCFVLTRAVFGALADVGESEPRTVSSAMRRLVARGLLGAVEIGGVPWVDVDTPADRVDAERLVASWTEAPAAGRR